MSVKQKKWILFLGIILLFWLSYLFSFSKAIEVRKQYYSLKKEQVIFSNIHQKLLLLKRQNRVYDSILTTKKIVTESSFQNNLLKTITVITDSTAIRIIAFNQPHAFKTENTIVNTYSFSLQGSFSEITKVIYLLEHQSKLGEIISVHFLKKKNYRYATNYLECVVLLQHVNSY